MCCVAEFAVDRSGNVGLFCGACQKSPLFPAIDVVRMPDDAAVFKQFQQSKRTSLRDVQRLRGKKWLCLFLATQAQLIEVIAKGVDAGAESWIFSPYAL